MMSMVEDAIFMSGDFSISARIIRLRWSWVALLLLTSVTYLIPKVIQLSVSDTNMAGSRERWVK